MAIFETFRALGLQCKVVPVMKNKYGWSRLYEGRTTGVHLAAGKFMPFNKCDNGSENLDEGHGFGREIPSGKVTWLNRSEDSGGLQAQMAYMAVSFVVDES